MKKLFCIALVCAFLLALAVPVLAANDKGGSGELIWTDGFEFHCNCFGGNEATAVIDLRDGSSVEKGEQKYVFGTTDNPITLVRIDGTTAWTLMTSDIECVNCHSTEWVTYSNKNGMINGKNIQAKHPGTPDPEDNDEPTILVFTATLLKLVDDTASEIAYTGSDEFEIVFTATDDPDDIIPVTVTPDDEIVITDLLECDKTYAITETEIDSEYFSLDSIVITINGEAVEGSVFTISDGDTIAIVVTNAYSKTVIPGGGDEPTIPVFTATLLKLVDDTASEVAYTGSDEFEIVFTATDDPDDIIPVTVTPDNEIVITDLLECDKTYAITETEADSEYFSLDSIVITINGEAVEGSVFTISDGDTIAIVVTNAYSKTENNGGNNDNDNNGDNNNNNETINLIPPPVTENQPTIPVQTPEEETFLFGDDEVPFANLTPEEPEELNVLAASSTEEYEFFDDVPLADLRPEDMPRTGDGATTAMFALAAILAGAAAAVVLMKKNKKA